MRAIKSLAHLSLAACLLGTVGLQAQETGLTRDFKVRYGYTTEVKDGLNRSIMGIGFNLGYVTTMGTFGVELGYSYKGGDPFLKPAGAQAAGLTPPDATLSKDSRRNTLDGFALRLSYSRQISENLGWQAGLMLGGTRLKHDYVGDMQSAGWAGATTGAAYTASWRDTYNGSRTEGGIKPSIFAGISWKLDKDSSVQVNLLGLNYSAVDYVHMAGSGTYATVATPTTGRLCDAQNNFPADKVEKTNRLVPHLEVAYVFHF